MKKALNETVGTVAYVLTSRQDELDFSSLTALKNSVTNILKSEDIKQKDLAANYIIHVNKMTSFNKLVSTVGTYMSGMKTISSYNRKG